MIGDRYTLEPVAYGLKFAGALRGAKLLQADLTGRIQAEGVDATACAANLPDGAVAVVILNKDAVRDLDVGSEKSGTVEIETLHAPAIDAREAHITREPNRTVKQGRFVVTASHSSGMRLTVR